VLFVLYTIFAFKADRHIKEVQDYMTTRAAVTLRTPIDLLLNRPKDLKIFVGTLPELDFPVVIPPHVIPCGPIYIPARPIEADDEELAKWLLQRPTVYINLGSICRVSESRACELARAIRIVLSALRSSPLQVLWKLKKEGTYETSEPGCRIFGILADEFKMDLVRIYEWLTPQPLAILQTGKISCSIHHGGANSYYEAVR
jgi:UDP:flavonoid glycosyltransferase YjiC (YdhE family)